MSADGILITGFPGFIAGRLVERLLADNDDGRFFLMCEPRFVFAARAKCEAIEKTHPAFAGRWHLVEGDVRQDDLALAPGVETLLKEHVRIVWHLAAIYDLAVPAALAYAVNVDGTVNVLDLCERLPHLERLMYVSTCFVAGQRKGRVYEDELDVGQTFKNHYESTKCWAEKHVRHRMKTIPTTIVRPAIVVGDSTTGETQKGDGPYFVMQLLFRLPAWAPMVNLGAMRAKVNLVPVDFVVDAMARLAAEPRAVGQTFALADPDPLTAREILERMVKTLNRAPVVGTLPWQVVAPVLKRRRIQKALRVPFESFAYCNHGVEFDTTRASSLLSELRAPCPPFEAYMPTLVDYARHHPSIFQEVRP